MHVMFDRTGRTACHRALFSLAARALRTCPLMPKVAADCEGMGELPMINQLIALRDGAGQEFASRIEDVNGRILTVGCQLNLSTDAELGIGATVLTTWRLPNGISVLPGRIIAARRDRMLPVWDIEVTGEGWREQRRSYVRAEMPGSLTLHWYSPAEVSRQAAASLTDLSEAGLRCITSAELFAGDAVAGLAVQVALRTWQRRFELAGEVLRALPGKKRGHWEVVVIFTDPGKAADDLRRLVYAEQLRQRNGR
jgi:c-di-GMP-binding flagellar brake protein YcgR